MDHRPWIPGLDASLIMVALITGSTACIQLILDFHRRLQFEDPSGAIALRPFVVIVLTLLIESLNGWFVYDDLSRSRQQYQRRSRRLSRHLQRMMIALIAVLTAFFIVELSARFFDRGYVLLPLYLGPGLLLSPLLILLMRKVASLPDTPECA